MAEGVAAGGTVIAEPTFDDRKVPPPDDPAVAPLGWMWNTADRRWRPKKRTGRGGYAATPAGRAPAQSTSRTEPGPAPDRDPDPGWFVHDDDRGGRKDEQLSFDDVDLEKVKNDIGGFAGLIGAPVLAMLQQIDPYCGGALAANFTPIVDATLPLLVRSEKIVRYFTDDKNDWLLWGKLAFALAPVGRAIYEHHIAKSVSLVRDDDGVVHVIRGQAEEGYGSHLQPPQSPPFDASAYAA